MSPTRCAFEAGVFSAENWNCATANALRDLAWDLQVFNEDQHAALVPLDEPTGAFLVLGWYKSRGCTEFAAVLDETEIRPLDIAFAEGIIAGNVLARERR